MDDAAAAARRVPRVPLRLLVGAALRLDRARAPGALGTRPRGGGRRGLRPHGRDLGRARLQHPVRRVARPPVPARPALVRVAVRPALHRVLEPGRVRLQRAAAAAHARRRHLALLHAEALLEPLHTAGVPHVHVAGARRQRGARALPAHRDLHLRGHGRRATAGRPRLPGSRSLSHEPARVRLRRRRRRADGGDARDAPPYPRPARAAAHGAPFPGRVLRGARGRARPAADRPGRALPRVPPRHLHLAGPRQARQPPLRAGAARRRVPRHRVGLLPARGARPAVEAPAPQPVPRHPAGVVDRASSTRTPIATSPRSRPAPRRSRPPPIPAGS